MSAQPRRRRADHEPPRDPYGQPVRFNDRHTKLEDYENRRVLTVPQDSDEAIARSARTSALDALLARLGLPGTIVLIVVLRLLDVELL